ncbi:hypothetical protein [Kitasatospora sp. NPDC050543]|uniref:hypothetical protein n=1 Tax=Kitasatospora sp. NPDC050543 TaxID=3364054 RepID=UPI00379D353D
MQGRQLATGVRQPAPHPLATRASLLAALTEAVRDRDERVLRRLLARFAEQAALTDLPALRDALDPRHHSGCARHPHEPARDSSTTSGATDQRTPHLRQGEAGP